MTTKKLAIKRVKGHNARFFTSLNLACRFQRRLFGDEWRTSKLEWLSAYFDNTSVEFKQVCKHHKKDGLYRVAWVKD